MNTNSCVQLWKRGLYFTGDMESETTSTENEVADCLKLVLRIEFPSKHLLCDTRSQRVEQGHSGRSRRPHSFPWGHQYLESPTLYKQWGKMRTEKWPSNLAVFGNIYNLCQSSLNTHWEGHIPEEKNHQSVWYCFMYSHLIKAQKDSYLQRTCHLFVF